MRTDLFAKHKAIDRIPIFQAKAITATSSVVEYATRDIGETAVHPVFADVIVGPMAPQTAPIWPTFTDGFDYVSLIDPILVQGQGAESAIHLLAKRLSQIPDVVAVSYSTDGNVHLIWTFIGQRNKQVRRQVYREELRVMQEFPAATFDFNVVALDQLQERPLLHDDLQGWIVFYRAHALVR